METSKLQEDVSSGKQIQESVSQSSKATEDKGKAAASSLDANLVELDPRFTKEDLKEQKREKKDPLNAELLRLVPDGEFELVPYGNDPSKNFKIDKDLSKLVKAKLTVTARFSLDLIFNCFKMCLFVLICD